MEKFINRLNTDSVIFGGLIALIDNLLDPGYACVDYADLESTTQSARLAYVIFEQQEIPDVTKAPELLAQALWAVPFGHHHFKSLWLNIWHSKEQVPINAIDDILDRLYELLPADSTIILNDTFDNASRCNRVALVGFG